MDHFYNFLRDNGWIELMFERGLRILFIFVILFACTKLIHLASVRILKMAHKTGPHGPNAYEREKRLSTVVKLLDTTLRIILIATGLLMLVGELGLDITPFLTGAGIAGLAIGFGAQSLVKDVISGFFLLIENQIRVGDVVKINGSITGSVERMELRITALRDKEGTLHIVPNGEIKTVSNMTYEFSNAVIALPIPYATDLTLLTKTLSKVASQLEQDPAWKEELYGRPEFLGITAFLSDHMIVELTVRTDPHARALVSRELHRRIKLALEQAGIALPSDVSYRTGIARD